MMWLNFICKLHLLRLQFIKSAVFAIGYMGDSFKDVPPLNLVQALQACVMCLSAELLPHTKQRWI